MECFGDMLVREPGAAAGGFRSSCQGWQGLTWRDLEVIGLHVGVGSCT